MAQGPGVRQLPTAIQSVGVAMWLQACCLAQPPCPQVAPPPAEAATASTAAPAVDTPRPKAKRAKSKRGPTPTASPGEQASAAAATATPPPATCILGAVRTAGELVFDVKNADISVREGDRVLGTTSTDEQGRFVWCLAARLPDAGAKLTVEVRKAPFQTASAVTDVRNDVHSQVDFALEAEGLTD